MQNLFRRAIRLVPLMGLIIPGFAHAQTVTSWQSAVTVAQSGVITVQETIVYNPEDGNHHGIIRTIPGQLHDTAGHTYYTTMQLKSVTDEQGRPYPIASQQVNYHGIDLKIGAKDTLINPGPHTYVITYSITPLVTHTASADRLLLNIIGTSWETPVITAGATITLPNQAKASNLACFTGRAGSTQSDCTISQSANGLISTSTTRQLDSLEAYTVDVSMPPASLAAYLVPDKRPPLTPAEIGGYVLLAVAGLLLLVGFGLLLWRAWQQYQGRHNQTIIPIYEPPAGLTPAHMSVLESPAADVADITATLIHLAVRGVIKIQQTRPKTWWRNAGYTLLKVGSFANLAPFEASLVNGLFGEDSSVNLDMLTARRLQISKGVQEFRKQLGTDLTKQGYFLSSPTGGLSAARWLTGALAVSLAFGAAAAADDAPASDGIALVIALCAAGLAAGFVYACSRASGRSVSGNQEWAQVRGFKWFLEVTEKDRLNFSDAPEKTPELFSKMLPYAIALKVEKQWAKQFANIDVSPAVSGWYVGGALGNFSADSFTSSFTTSFGGAMSSSFGGASGGGSAGGGGGGGGGGGW